MTGICYNLSGCERVRRRGGDGHINSEMVFSLSLFSLGLIYVVGRESLQQGRYSEAGELFGGGLESQGAWAGGSVAIEQTCQTALLSRDDLVGNMLLGRWG